MNDFYSISLFFYEQHSHLLLRVASCFFLASFFFYPTYYFIHLYICIIIYIHNYIQPYMYLYMNVSIHLLPPCLYKTRFEVSYYHKRSNYYACACVYMYVCVRALKEIVCVASFIRSLACLIWEFVFIGSTFLLLPSFFCFLFFYFSSSEEAFFIIARMFTIITSVRSVFAICLWRFAVVVVVASHFIINWLSFILFHDSIIVDASIIVIVAQWAEWLFIRIKKELQF